MISLQLNDPINAWPNNKHINNISMMAGHHPRKYISRSPHPDRPKRPSLRNNSIYYFRSPILYRILLSILPLKSCPHTRTRWLLAPNRYSPTQSPRSPITQHFRPSSLRSLNHLSPPQPYRRKPQPHATSPIHHHCPRCILHTPTSLRILRSTLYHLRRRLRLDLFRSHWIPWPPCNYWIYFLNRLLFPSTKISLYLKSPLWLRSSCLILTFRRRSMTFPLCFYLLMRIMFF